MHDDTKRLACSMGLILGISALACGSGDNNDEEVREPTLEERCEQRCAPPQEPAADADPADHHPCVGQTAPDDCVERCVETVQSTTGIADPDTCQECVMLATGWWGRRVIRHATSTLNIKTSCETVLYRGGARGGSKEFDFSVCTESATCDGFVFPEPADGTYCGPKCGYELVDQPDPIPDAGAPPDLGPPHDAGPTLDTSSLDLGHSDLVHSADATSDSGQHDNNDATLVDAAHD